MDFKCILFSCDLDAHRKSGVYVSACDFDVEHTYMSNATAAIELNVINGRNNFSTNVEADTLTLVNDSQDHEQPSTSPALVVTPPEQLGSAKGLLLTLMYLWSELATWIKAQNRYLRHLRILLTKASSLTVIVITLFGILFYALRTYDIAQWTATKDFWEYCHSSQVSVSR